MHGMSGGGYVTNAGEKWMHIGMIECSVCVPSLTRTTICLYILLYSPHRFIYMLPWANLYALYKTRLSGRTYIIVGTL